MQLSRCNLPTILTQLVTRALLSEVQLTPKPGLVDSQNSGAHTDMDLALFTRSIAAIVPYIVDCFLLGQREYHLPVSDVLPLIRPTGIAAESSMYMATNNVNTHKGAIFSFSLLCVAIGRLSGRLVVLSVDAICDEVAAICQGLVARELAGKTHAKTAGERLYHQYGFSGVRGEAASGFALVRRIALPTYLKSVIIGHEFASLHALLQLMSVNNDTNIVSRGGRDGLYFTQKKSTLLLQHPAWQEGDNKTIIDLVTQFDQAMTAKNLSPGGSADLLAITLFLTHFT